MPQGPISVAGFLDPSGVTKPGNLDSGGNLKIAGTLAAPAGGLPTKPQGATAYNDAVGTAGHQIKTGAGTLASVTVNTPGTSSTAVLYDGTNTSGTKLATIDTSASKTLTYNLAFTTGLFIVSSTVTPADITVGYY